MALTLGGIKSLAPGYMAGQDGDGIPMPFCRVPDPRAIRRGMLLPASGVTRMVGTAVVVRM